MSLFSASLLTSVILLTPTPSAAVAPLSEAEQGALAGIVADPAPKSLVRGNHYVVCNEYRPHLFYDVLEGRTGPLIGVGTDQLYTFAAWARSELVFPMDFDAVIVDLHHVYAILFKEADTPEAFLDLWRKKRFKAVQKLLDEKSTDAKQRKRLKRVHRFARASVYARLKRLIRTYKKTKTPTFMTDQAQYEHIVNLIKAGRVIPLRGDLTKEGALRSIGTALASMGKTVDILYVSNAEQYFQFGEAYKKNINLLPTDAESLILRTASISNTSKEAYRYEAQTIDDFRLWLAGSIRKVREMRYYRKPRSGKHSHWLKGPPED